MTDSPPNDLKAFLDATAKDIAEEYERVRTRTAEDPGTAGDQGEENWAEVLRSWLPSTYHVVTKGRILAADGKASRQVDVIVLQPSYPPRLLTKKMFLAGGVAAAFECKLTLRAQHIGEAVEGAAELRRLFKEQGQTPLRQLQSSLLYGLLAHSHDWKKEESTPADNIERALLDADKTSIGHPCEMLDLLCVADVATWTASKAAYFGPGYTPWSPDMEKIYGKEGSATTAYIRHEAEPVAVLVESLCNKLARWDASLRGLARYFALAIKGQGKGLMRHWPPSIYTNDVREKIVRGALVNGEAWNEWSFAFM